MKSPNGYQGHSPLQPKRWAPCMTNMDPAALKRRNGMFGDIWETPQVLQRILEAHLRLADGSGGAFTCLAQAFSPPDRAPPAARPSVSFPRLEAAFPEGHRFAGRTPLELMGACRPGNGGRFRNKFTIIGCGTSWHGALLGEYCVETLARIPVEVQYASEFRYKRPLLRSGDVFVIVSNSGETSDAVACLKMLQDAKTTDGVLTVAICNGEGSTIAQQCDAAIDVLAGTEGGVASTKAFSATYLMFLLLGIALADAQGTLPDEERSKLMDKLQELPSCVQEVLEREAGPIEQSTSSHDRLLSIGDCQLWDISCQNVLAQNLLFLGRGFNFPIALEGAMKIKEIASIHAEGYPAAEMKHGPIALIDQFMPVVVIAPRSDPTYEKIKSNLQEVKTRNGAIIAITEVGNDELAVDCEHVITVPFTHEYLMPLLAVIPLQLLAYMMGTLRGAQSEGVLQKSYCD